MPAANHGTTASGKILRQFAAGANGAYIYKPSPAFGFLPTAGGVRLFGSGGGGGGPTPPVPLPPPQMFNIRQTGG